MGSPRPRRSPPPSTHTTSRRDSPPAREKHFTYARSPKRDLSRSPSPRTKRLRRSQAERESEKVNDREPERNRGRGSDKGVYRGRGDDRDKGSRGDRDKGSRGDRDFDRHAHRERGLEKSNNGKNLRNEEGSDRDIGKDGKGLERGNGRSLDRETDKDTRKGRGSENERSMERRSGRDESKSRRGHSSSPSDRHHRSRNRSRSPQQDADIRGHDKVTNSRGDEKRNDNDDGKDEDEDEDESVARMKAAEEALAAKEKEKPSFELSGKLAAETNRVKGITLLFTEPPDARKPDVRWRLYVFKNGEALSEPLYIHRQSCYLFGRERRVADIPTDHPSCSKQHAVIQFRQVEKERPDGTLKKQVRPYVMDLGSTNKTLLNENPIEPERYYELFEKDTIKFGNSSREYVLLHENSA